MTARVFVHPRCLDGPASGALGAYLQDRGFDMERTVTGPPNARGHCELVHLVEKGPLAMTLRRFDGTEFIHKTGQVAPPPDPRAA